MIYTFIKNNEKIFPIERCAKVLQVGQRLLSMEKPVCFREKTKLNLLKQNNFHLF
jgi:hypothetical protein